MSAPQASNPLLDLANALRSSKTGIEAHSAVVEGLRVEYIRGQDLVAHVEAKPDLFARFSTKGKAPAEQAKEVGELLLRRGLLRRCDHMYKKPPPGKKLAKFPRKLVFFHGGEALTFSEDSFYAWTYERPTSPWVYVGAALAVLGALLASLFPLAPNWVKILVLYLSAGLLAVILGVMLIRVVVAAVTWIATGQTVWILPNILSEVPLKELFRPWISVEPSDPTGWGSHLLVRLGVGAGLAGVLYVLYAHAPDTGSVVREASKYRDELFDLLSVHREGYERIAAGNDSTAAAAATAGTGNDSAAAVGSGGAAGGPAVGVEFELYAEE